MYHEAMVDLFKQIPTMISKPLTKDKKIQLILTDIGGARYMKKMIKKPPPLKNRS